MVSIADNGLSMPNTTRFELSGRDLRHGNKIVKHLLTQDDDRDLGGIT